MSLTTHFCSSFSHACKTHHAFVVLLAAIFIIIVVAVFSDLIIFILLFLSRVLRRTAAESTGAVVVSVGNVFLILIRDFQSKSSERNVNVTLSFVFQ